ncbi:MAG: hypothetical protein AB8B94_19340 [Hyphomicrobiales bacterium]
MTSESVNNTTQSDTAILVPTREDTLIYVAELVVELEKMAKDADFPLVSYLLSMAAREASHEIFDKGLFITTTRQ